MLTIILGAIALPMVYVVIVFITTKSFSIRDFMLVILVVVGAIIGFAIALFMPRTEEIIATYYPQKIMDSPFGEIYFIESNNEKRDDGTACNSYYFVVDGKHRIIAENELVIVWGQWKNGDKIKVEISRIIPKPKLKHWTICSFKEIATIYGPRSCAL